MSETRGDLLAAVGGIKTTFESMKAQLAAVEGAVLKPVVIVAKRVERRRPTWRQQQIPVKVKAKPSLGETCPRCRSRDTRLSSTRSLSDYLLFFMDFEKVRCRQCQELFRVRGSA